MFSRDYSNFCKSFLWFYMQVNLPGGDWNLLVCMLYMISFLHRYFGCPSSHGIGHCWWGSAYYKHIIQLTSRCVEVFIWWPIKLILCKYFWYQQVFQWWGEKWTLRCFVLLLVKCIVLNYKLSIVRQWIIENGWQL